MCFDYSFISIGITELILGNGNRKIATLYLNVSGFMETLYVLLLKTAFDS